MVASVAETYMTRLSIKRRAAHGSMIALILLTGTAARAADEEPVCRSLLQQIGFATQRASSASDDVREKAKYLERIALMERSALQNGLPQLSSAAAAFDSELARANQSLDAARTREAVAGSALDVAISTYVQQCPQHFAAIHGDYLQLGILSLKAMSDPEQQAPSK